jgi:glycine N-methyltransferase
MTSKVDSVFRTRSLGIASSGLADQYADGKAAKVWQLYIGDQTDRTKKYREFLVNLLKSKGCKRILDVACGTGVDSVMLLEDGFELISSDASDKMLKTAYKTRWDRRKEDAFDKWIIEEGNWLTLTETLDEVKGEEGFDAIICMGNSFAHLPDFSGDQHDQRLAISNFHKLLKPGGVLVIDHRNYDFILENGYAPTNNIYYNSEHIEDIKTSILYVNNHPNLITLDYSMDVSDIFEDPNEHYNKFRLSYYPHRLEAFGNLLSSVFGPKASHSVFADFKSMEEQPNPAFYIHTIEKN